MFADELAKMEVKFKEQLKTNENLKLQLAAEEDRYKVSSSECRHVARHSGHPLPLPCSAASQARRPLDTCCVFPTAYGCFSSGMESLMLSLPLNAVTLTVLFMSRPICETTFYCCLCQALETSGA